MADDPETTGTKQSGRFRPGQSGNPSGRPKGSFNRATMLAQALLGREAGKLARKAIELALAGDVVALKLCLERLVPVPKASRFVALDLPPLRTVDDLVKAAAVIVAEVAAGRLAMEDVGPLVSLIETSVEAIRVNDHDARLIALEKFAEGRRLHAVG